ncbi:MAG: quinolinate synthase NadA [Candidatus Muirbacterium halophilum]|nr:quinolinate synthase NadA [Candidatus Muirbacterium halophilum]MCK9474794.1 quinolinate synthase NadA [Candidatus Muirbacterium halophilum]
MNLINEINKLKKEKDVLILGHYYLDPKVQDIADYLGDSYGLAKKAMDCKEKIILFAGVVFMAETAKILNPSKKVLAVTMDAGCPMADMINSNDIIAMREKYKNLYVVSYVNSTADVKTQSDICVTSRNALDIVRDIPSKYKNILFVPDKNLGSYIIKKTDRNMILWDGFCCVHNDISADTIKKAKEKYKDSVIIVHPECNSKVVEKCDFAMSTSQMVDYASKNTDKTIFVGTETGVLHSMKKYNSKVYSLSEKTICKNMKKNTLEEIYNTLDKEVNEIVLSNEVLKKAYIPIKRMIDYTEKRNSQ